MKSKLIRQIFLEYFCKRQKFEYFIPNPIKYFSDTRVPVINSGLSQLKDVLNCEDFKTAGYIKCAVDGTLNDYATTSAENHHTFHEMFGNRNISSNKHEACELALNLLTQEYGLCKSLLKISFYAGDPHLPLKADRECEETWKGLGFSDDVLIPGGADTNFMEMGKCGACGTSSGIFYLHTNGLLQELGKIIFISHDRDINGQWNELPLPYTVSGILLHTLTTILQNKVSRYDTDLFQPLIKAMEKNCRGQLAEYGKSRPGDISLDDSYRKLADYSRTISMCLADGLSPSSNFPLLKLMHKAFRICEQDFLFAPGFLQELYNIELDIMGDIYPDLRVKENYVREILHNEEYIYTSRDEITSKLRNMLNADAVDIMKNRQPLDMSFNCMDENGNISGDDRFFETVSEAVREDTEELENMDTSMRINSSKSIMDLITQEVVVGIQESIACNRNYMVHFLACSYLMEFVALSEDIFKVSHIPVMLFACCNGVIRVSCCVPMPWVTKSFDATKWLSKVTPTFNAVIELPEKKQSSKIFASMSGTKVSLINCENLVQHAMKEAIDFIKTNLPQHPELPEKHHTLPEHKLFKSS